MSRGKNKNHLGAKRTTANRPLSNLPVAVPLSQIKSMTQEGLLQFSMKMLKTDAATWNRYASSMLKAKRVISLEKTILLDLVSDGYDFSHNAISNNCKGKNLNQLKLSSFRDLRKSSCIQADR